MPRSLLVFCGEAYSDCLHGILEAGGCTGTLGSCTQKVCATPAAPALPTSTRSAPAALPAEVEEVDASVVNAEEAGVEVGQQLPRGGERVSLTVRRVLRTFGVGLPQRRS